MRILLLPLLLLVFVRGMASAQSAPEQRLLLVGGQVQTSADSAPRKADVLIVGERIEAVGEGLKAEGATLWDATGLVISPAFVDAANLGLLDDSAFRGGAGDMAADMFEGHDSLPRERLARAGIGLVYVDIALQDASRGLVGCVASTDPKGANVTVLERLAGLSFAIGTRAQGIAGRMGRSGEVAAVGEALSAARRYRTSFEKHTKDVEKHAKDMKEAEAKQAKADKPDKPEKTDKKSLPPQKPRIEELHETVLRTLDHKAPLRIEAHWREDIEAALELATKQGLRLVLLGGGEADEVADKLATAKAVVVLGPAQPLWVSPLLAPRRRNDLAAKLDAAGVRIAFMSAGARGYRSDSAPLIAALHVAEGLSEAAALRALTLGAAEAIGLGGRCGSVEPGRLALLQLRTSKLSLDGAGPQKMVFGTSVIDGKKS